MSERIVEVILDRFIDQHDLADKANEGAAKTINFLKRSMRVGLTKKMPPQAFAELFQTLVYATVAGHAEAALRLSRNSLKAELAAVRAAGREGVEAVPALTKAHIMARAAARKGLTDGESPPHTAAKP